MATTTIAKKSKLPTDPDGVDLVKLLSDIHQTSQVLFDNFMLHELVEELQECIDIYNWPAKDWYTLLERPENVKKSYYTVNQIIKFMVRFEPLHEQLSTLAEAIAMAKKNKEESGTVQLKAAS